MNPALSYACRLQTWLLTAIAIAFLYNPTQAFSGTYSIAKSYQGLHEKKHRSRLKRKIGVDPRGTPWCGAFVGTVVKRSGKKPPTGYNKASTWMRWGKPVRLSSARKGDVVVIRTRVGTHVAFYAGLKGNRILLLGGNQSDQVKISAYNVKSVRAIRRGGGGRANSSLEGFRFGALWYKKQQQKTR